MVGGESSPGCVSCQWLREPQRLKGPLRAPGPSRSHPDGVRAARATPTSIGGFPTGGAWMAARVAGAGLVCAVLLGLGGGCGNGEGGGESRPTLSPSFSPPRTLPAPTRTPTRTERPTEEPTDE